VRLWSVRAGKKRDLEAATSSDQRRADTTGKARTPEMSFVGLVQRIGLAVSQRNEKSGKHRAKGRFVLANRKDSIRRKTVTHRTAIPPGACAGGYKWPNRGFGEAELRANPTKCTLWLER